MSEPETNAGRTGWVKAVPYTMLAVYAVGPLLLIPAVSTPWPVVGFIFAVAAAAGLIDGFAFRPNWSLTILAGVGFWIAKVLYFNDGTFIYALGAAATCAAAMGLSRLLSVSPSTSNAEDRAEDRAEA